jgi:hypothetical protein
LGSALTEWDAIKDIFNLRARSVLSADMRFIILIFMNYQFKNHLRSGHQKPFKKGHIVPVVICDLSWFDLVLWAGKCQVGLKSVTSFSVLRQRGKAASVSLLPSSTSSPMPLDQRYRQQGFLKILPSVLRLQFYVEVSGPFLL